jgi:hypothetical protein
MTLQALLNTRLPETFDNETYGHIRSADLSGRPATKMHMLTSAIAVALSGLACNDNLEDMRSQTHLGKCSPQRNRNT